MHGDLTVETVTQFIAQLGPNDFSWDGTPLTLRLGDTDTVHIESHHAGLVLAVLRTIEEYELHEKADKALRLVHPDHQFPFVIQTGMKGDHEVAFLAILPTTDLNISTMTEALDILNYLHVQLNN